MVPSSSPEERKVVATLAPATSNCEAETKPEPSIFNEKPVPVTVCVTDPEAKMGSGFKILTLKLAEPVVPVVALMVTEWPAKMVDAGE
jgi:hypothetical protein